MPLSCCLPPCPLLRRAPSCAVPRFAFLHSARNVNTFSLSSVRLYRPRECDPSQQGGWRDYQYLPSFKPRTFFAALLMQSTSHSHLVHASIYLHASHKSDQLKIRQRRFHDEIQRYSNKIIMINGKPPGHHCTDAARNKVNGTSRSATKSWRRCDSLPALCK